MPSFETEWRKRFERFARHHEADHLVSGWSNAGLRRRLSLFAALVKESDLPPSCRVLDLGCGAGTYVRFLKGEGYRAVGLDYSLPSLQRAVSAEGGRGGAYVGGEAYHLPFQDGCFDAVVSIGVLQALAEPKTAVGEMVRVLRPGGLLALDFLNALEVIALARSVSDRVRGRAPRLHAYSPKHVQGWMAELGLTRFRRTGVYLPPRSIPFLGRILDRDGIIRMLEGTPGVPLAFAHAFLLAGRKGKAIAPKFASDWKEGGAERHR